AELLAEMADDGAAGQNTGMCAEEADTGRPRLPRRPVPRRHMADFMRQNAGHLRLVIGEGQQAAGDVDIATRQREGVDDGRVQHRKTPRQIAHLGDEGEPEPDVENIVIEAGVDIFTAILRNDLLMMLRAYLAVIARLEDGK